MPSSNAQVSAADLENVRLSQQALLATDYFSLAAEDMQQTVLLDTIEAYQQNLKLTTDRFNGGVASRSDITLAQTQLAGAKAQSTDLRVLRAQYEHAIAMLTGQPPVSLDIDISKIGDRLRPFRPFRWPFPHSFSSGVPTSRRASARWLPPTRTSGLPRPLTIPR